MNLPETGTEAKARLEIALGEFGIPAKVADEVMGHHTVVHYSRGSLVFPQGSPADLLFWVFTGLVKVYCPRTDGTRFLIDLAGPGDLIGHVDYIDSKGRRAQVFEVEALTKCSIALFTREHVIKLLQSLDHATLLQMIERINTAWSAKARRFGTFLGMSFRERLEVVLSELGVKFGVREMRGTLLMPELSHADLADMIGSSRPMVSRLIAEMTDAGLLLRQNKQFILLERFMREHGSLTQSKAATAATASNGSTEPRAKVASVAGSLFHPLNGKNGKVTLGPVSSDTSKARVKDPLHT